MRLESFRWKNWEMENQQHGELWPHLLDNTINVKWQLEKLYRHLIKTGFSVFLSVCLPFYY